MSQSTYVTTTLVLRSVFILDMTGFLLHLLFVARSRIILQVCFLTFDFVLFCRATTVDFL